MIRTTMVMALALAAGCGGGTDRAELATLSFEAPRTWQRTDTHGSGSVTAVFAPGDNARKETVTVIRTELGPIAAQYSTATLTQLLTGTQTGLRNARTQAITRVATDSGLHGLQVVVDYVPTGLARPYHRVHAVLLDGTALVHVLYTALAPDPELAAFRQVLSTLREES